MRTYSLDKVADAADGNLDDIRPDGYSGRGMYGKTCAAVTFPNAQAIYRFFTQLGYEALRKRDLWRVSHENPKEGRS